MGRQFANLHFALTPGTSVGPQGTALFSLILDYRQHGTMGRVTVTDPQNSNWTAKVPVYSFLPLPFLANFDLIFSR